MIQIVELRNWRAYGDATIDLSAPVTFFVAPNGVGKSSLVEAVRWALLGLPNARKAAAAVRLGSDEASVAVELQLDADTPLHLIRTLTAKGKSEFRATFEGVGLTEADFRDLLTQHWEADPTLIDRLMFTDPELPTTKSDFPVREHLAATLGVTPLLESATGLEQTRREVSDRVAALRDEVVDARSRLEEFKDAATDAATRLEEVLGLRTELGLKIQVAEAELSAERLWEQYRSSVAKHNGATSAILSELSAVIEVDPDAVEVATLTRAEEDAAAAVETARAQKGASEIAQARSESASDLLENAEESCPTCLRPLNEHERSSAMAIHGQSAKSSGSHGFEAAEELSAATARFEALHAFSSRLADLQPPDRPSEDEPETGSELRLLSLKEQDSALTEEVGQLRAVAKAESDREALSGQLTDQIEALRVAAHEEQLLITAVEIMNSLGNKVLRDRIDPLIGELSDRWKLLFGSEGLTLEPTGELVVQAAAGRLGIADLSGGERATAILITRLLLAAATTKIPTVWFDEPLEHLDPRRRAAVARTLVRAGQTKTVRQVIITTYEERIARQLAAADPENVRVVSAANPSI